MLHTIYAQPLWRVTVEILLGTLLWAALRATLGRKRPKPWRGLNLCLLAASLFGVVLVTMLHRNPGEHELILLPGYFLQEGKIQPEIYRSLLMNVLLFAPVGLTLSAALAQGRKASRCVLLTVLIGLACSVTVEAVQYVGNLGRAETDDVLANMLGTVIGALHVPIGNLFRTD